MSRGPTLPLLPPDQVESHRQGWTDIVAKLEQVLGSPGRPAR